jgi:hypothetical protein
LETKGEDVERRTEERAKGIYPREANEWKNAWRRGFRAMVCC